MRFDFKQRYERILYTLKHKRAFLEVEKRLRGRNTLHGYLHDWDKPFLYLSFWLDLKKVQQIHRKHSRHHVRNTLDKTREDLIDTVIDWECARMTKPDKPLNAYQTLMKFYPEYAETYLPIIKELLPEQVVPQPAYRPVRVASEVPVKDNTITRHPAKARPQATSALLQQALLTKKSR